MATYPSCQIAGCSARAVSTVSLKGVRQSSVVVCKAHQASVVVSKPITFSFSLKDWLIGVGADWESFKGSTIYEHADDAEWTNERFTDQISKDWKSVEVKASLVPGPHFMVWDAFSVFVSLDIDDHVRIIRLFTNFDLWRQNGKPMPLKEFP